VKAQVIRAELVGDDIATALGITAKSPTPVIRLCVMLIEAGHDPAAQLHVYRGKTLALTVRSIGEGARLVINGKGSGFRRARAVGTAPLMRQNGEGLGVPNATSPAPQVNKPARSVGDRTRLAAVSQIERAKGGRGRKGGISEAARQAGVSRFAVMRAAKRVRRPQSAGKGSDEPKPVSRGLSAKGGR
jgi:hypothetical protein